MRGFIRFFERVVPMLVLGLVLGTIALSIGASTVELSATSVKINGDALEVI